MIRNLASAAFAAAILGLVQPAAAAQRDLTPAHYDCQARMAHPTPVPPAPHGEADAWQCAVPGNHKLSTALDWFRDSLEYCRIATSAYRDATRAAYRAAVRHGPGGWIVFLDADETVLDNSLYEREQQRCGRRFSQARWDNWLKAGIARAMPGAAAFTQLVHRLGGYVAIVTNRNATIDKTTRRNLRADGLWFDYEIGHRKGTPDDKVARWKRAVEVLTRIHGDRPVPVIWVGDQVTDFPKRDAGGHFTRAMSQSDPGRGIGVHYFLIPNPIYGNWTKNPEN